MNRRCQKIRKFIWLLQRSFYRRSLLVWRHLLGGRKSWNILLNNKKKRNWFGGFCWYYIYECRWSRRMFFDRGSRPNIYMKKYIFSKGALLKLGRREEIRDEQNNFLTGDGLRPIIISKLIKNDLWVNKFKASPSYWQLSMKISYK